MELTKLAEIFSGHTFRGRIENDPDGDCSVLQLKDVDLSHRTFHSNPHRFKTNGVSGKQYLQKGDLLFAAKGANNYALVFDKDEKAVASSVFFVIRPKADTINPYFLAWYINQPTAQAYLRRGKEGTMVTNISKATLEQLQIVVPSIELQNRIAKVSKLMQEEIFLTEAIFKKKKLFIQAELHHAIAK